MNRYSKKVLAASSVIAVLSNCAIANASERAVFNNENNKNISLNDVKANGRKIYVQQIHLGIENGSERNPYRDFTTAYAVAKDGDTIILKGNVTISGQGSHGGDPFVCKKNITIEGMEGTNAELNSRSPFQLEANVAMKNFTWSFPGVSADNRRIFLNGYKLTMDNVPVEVSSVVGKPTVYAGSYKNLGSKSGNNAELLVNNTTGKNTVFENIYAGDYFKEFNGNVTLSLNSGVKVEDSIYAGGTNYKVNGDVNVYAGNVYVNNFVKKNNVGKAFLNLNNFNGATGTSIVGFNNVTLNNSNVKINNDNSLEQVNDFKLLGNSILDLSSKKSLNVEGNFFSEEGSRIVVNKDGRININQNLNGVVELRTPGMDSQTSGLVSINHTYISASNNSTGRVIFKPFWNQTMYELKSETVGNKKQWTTRVTDKEKLNNVEFSGNNKIEISDYNFESYDLQFKDKNGKELEYTPIFETKVLDSNGEEVSEDDILAEVWESQNQMIVELYNSLLPEGKYKVVLTDTLTNKEYVYEIELYK